ncbi:hypothetical protein CANARDRAFT_23280 [[Candida] arabinofermentans NRRL YB-2248]|uniref:C2 domain-containing protein n=1 Tax=[Candida] arabinofermentans NRRL YB-2248 TaxID=983967 RepID=A0A1E4T0B9_9ASCO|nr:hypothetical protein CANARDRAFT_23280 [[Candida] arabinofermentans NRRL YB-2248]
MDPQGSLDPLIRAVYLMYKSDKRFLPKSISEYVGSSPMNLMRTTSNESSMSSSTRSSRLSFSRMNSVKPESLFSDLAFIIDSLNVNRNSEVGDVDMDPVDEDRFKTILLLFNESWNRAVDRDIAKIIQQFQLSAARVLARDDPTKVMLFLAYFIDLLLSKKTTHDQRSFLLNERSKVISKKITPRMNIMDLHKFKLIAKVYNTTLEHISNRVLAMRAGCRDIDILNELDQKSSKKIYQISDFEGRQSDYEEWKLGRERFFHKALDRFQQERSNINLARTQARKVSPDDPYNCFDLVFDMFLNYNSSLDHISISILTDCLFVWQLDGYQVFISVIKAYLRAARQVTHDSSITLEARNTAKKLLDFCCLPYKPEIWPKPIKDQCYLFDEICRPILEDVIQLLPKMFESESLSGIVTGLIQIIYNSPFGVSRELKESFSTKLNEVKKQRYRHRISLIPRSIAVSFNDIIGLLEGTLEDLRFLNTDQVLLDFENQHSSEWSLSWPLKHYFARNAFTDTRNIIEFMSRYPTPSYDVTTTKYKREMKDPHVSTSDPKFVHLLELLLNIKNESMFADSEFGEIVEDVLFPDYFNLCVDWCIDLSRRALNVIKEDQYLKISGTFSSEGVIGLFELFEAYLTKVDQLEWYDVYQNACYFTLVYETISKILNLYAQRLTTDVANSLVSSNSEVMLYGENGDVSPLYIKINNLYAVTSKLDSIFRDDVLDNFSRVIKKKSIISIKKYGGATDAINRGKLICINVWKAENLEDFETGSKLNTFVKVTGCIENRTKTIEADSYPEWGEEFDAVVADDTDNVIVRPENIQFQIFDETNATSSRLIETFNYRLTFEPHMEGVQQTIKLTNTKGIKLYINYTYETIVHDPIFYIGRTRTTLLRSTQRITKMMVSKYNALIRQTFTKETLDSVFAESPEFYTVGDFLEGTDDPDDIKDAVIVNLCRSFVDTIDTLSTVLDAQAIDELVIQTWEMVLVQATNLMLPSLASISSPRFKKQLALVNMKDTSLLNKFKSMSVNPETDEDRTISINEVERIISWVFKMFAAICGELDSTLHHRLLTPKLTQLLKARSLYYLTYQELQSEYNAALNECKEILNVKLDNRAKSPQPVPTFTTSVFGGGKSNALPPASTAFDPHSPTAPDAPMPTLSTAQEKPHTDEPVVVAVAPNGALRRSSTVMRQGTISLRQKQVEEETEEAVESMCFSTREVILRVVLAKEFSFVKLGTGVIGWVLSRMEEFEKIAKDAENKVLARTFMRQKSIIGSSPFSSASYGGGESSRRNGAM